MLYLVLTESILRKELYLSTEPIVQSTEKTKVSSVAVASSAHRPKYLQVCVPFIRKTTKESTAKDC